ncbi:MAG: chromate transporter [Clostridiales bacterium]|nr:chromate transporter [Candidatus Crickella equi]
MWELFVVFFKLGAFTIGGGIAMLPLLQNELIYSKKWFTEDEFLDAVAVCQGLPGVVAVNMATYVGYRRHGILGSLIATIGVILPSFVIILAIATGLAAFGDNHWIQGAMAGFRAAALGLVLVSVFQLGGVVFKKDTLYTVISAIVAFCLIVFLHVNTAWVILLFLVLGVILQQRVRPDVANSQQGDTPEDGGDK